MPFRKIQGNSRLPDLPLHPTLVNIGHWLFDYSASGLTHVDFQKRKLPHDSFFDNARLQTRADLEVRHNNMEENVLYYCI